MTDSKKRVASKTESLERGAVRDRLVAVAARHFADHGVQGASQRAIQREVGVNNSTANYYFGSKEALYQAVLEAALTPIQQEREAGLAALSPRAPHRQKLHELLTSYFSPHLRAATTELGHDYARIIASLHLTVPDSAIELLQALVTPVRDRYIDALSRLYPNASRNRLYEVLAFTVALMAMAPVRHGRTHLSRAEAEKLIREVVAVSEITFETLCGAQDPPGQLASSGDCEAIG